MNTAINDANANIVYTCPRFDVYETPKNKAGQLILKDGDRLHSVLPGKNVGAQFTIGSVISSARRDGRDPIAALEMAVKHNHKLHFIYGNGTCLSSSYGPRDSYLSVTVGDQVMFEGIVFEITAESNSNLGLARCYPGVADEE
jgi:hypothetical protein